LRLIDAFLAISSACYYAKYPGKDYARWHANYQGYVNIQDYC